MSKSSFEYNGIGSSISCNYSQIGMLPSAMYPTPGMLSSPPISPTTTQGFYIVPNYAPTLSYNTLTSSCDRLPDGSCNISNSTPSCNGFFNIDQAYGRAANLCSTQYSRLPCGGMLPPPQPQPIHPHHHPSPQPHPHPHHHPSPQPHPHPHHHPSPQPHPHILPPGPMR